VVHFVSFFVDFQSSANMTELDEAGAIGWNAATVGFHINMFPWQL